MNHKLINKIIAGLMFVMSFIVYRLTAQPSVSFWDCGEFAAASYYLQVPHPPGAPFFLLIGRIFMMIPWAENLGFRMNLVSVISSALTIMFLYLIIVKLIYFWRGKHPENLWDAISVYGAGIIGAATFTFTDTFWFSAVESEVYGFSMFFVSLIAWLMVLWYEKADEPGNEKILLFMAYMIGLSIGVHLLSVLAVLTIIMVIYFRKFEITFQTFIIMGVVAVLYFWAVYPGIVKWIPSVMAKIGGNQLPLKMIFIVAVLGLLVYGMYWTKKNGHSIIYTAIAAYFFMFIGFTTYSLVIIRSNVYPPMNENEPNTMNELVSYLNREQYGDFPVFQRRYSQEPHQQGIYQNYSSDLDFMWRYQIDHMFNRYLYWNFVGREGDIQDAKSTFISDGNPNYREGSNEFPNKYYAIPLLLGLFGLVWHFRKDWKMGVSFFSMFILMGILTALYQNQQEPQPRERDYFYVGAFFVYAIWIGLGVTGLFELIREKVANEMLKKYLPYGVFAVIFFAVPVNMAVQNWGDHDRSDNYIPWDFAYNLLQSCEPDGILITNGDNDTFPLWYLQDVEAVRRDVRIVNLSLANTDWYVKQLKNEEPYGAKKVPLSLTDAEITQMRPVQFSATTVTLPVQKDVIERLNIKDSAIVKSGSISFVMRPTLEFGDVTGVRMQDLVLKDIIETNARTGWKRPIHFSITCSDDVKLGTEQYHTRIGMTYLVSPSKNTSRGEQVDVEKTMACLYKIPEGYSKTPQYGFKFRGLQDGKLYIIENERRMMMNYASTFVSLAWYQLEDLKDSAACVRTLDRYEELLPRKYVKIDHRFVFNIANLYLSAGRKDKFIELSHDIEAGALKALEQNPTDFGSYYSPYRILIQIYEARGDYQKELDIYNRARSYNQDDAGLNAEIQRIENLIKNQQTQDTSKK